MKVEIIRFIPIPLLKLQRKEDMIVKEKKKL
jgi:hypothetical protein